MVFGPSSDVLANGSIALTASGDNQSNGFTLEKFGTTKFPLFLVLMEVAEQLRKRQIVLSVVWRPREENAEADALTNEAFEAFAPHLRVPVVWDELDWVILPKLTRMAEAHYQEMADNKRASRKRALKVGVGTSRGGRGARLRETDPW
jgi:hypothetical protein